MSTVFPRKKEKRSRSSSIEANNSFVKNVTSRVSGLLPATITKWFSSPSSNTNGSAQTADATDSSTEDEGPESPINNQPPTKRMRFTSPGTYNQFGPSNTNSTPTGNDTIDECHTYTVQSPPGRTTLRRETNFVSTPLRSQDVETTTDRAEKDTYKSHSVSTVGSTVATKRKSLFDSPAVSEASMRACAKTSANTMRDPNQPYFKPSLLGSPFYPGRTMYGGAAAYINQPNIQVRKNTLVNESKTNNDNTISHSARRIMDLLEQYSSPLNEAKRIAPYVHHSRQSSNNSSFESSSSPYGNKVQSYKTQELHVPSLASILRLKQRSRLMDTTNAARQIIASHSSTTDYLPYISHSTQRDQTDVTNKLKTKFNVRGSQYKRGDVSVETDFPEPVNLPSAVLQIDQDNLPKFSFGFSKVSQAPNSTSTPKAASLTNVDEANKVKESIITNKTMETPICKPETVSSSYKFSRPVRINCDTSQMTATPLKFTFGSPDRSIDNVQTNKTKVPDSFCFVGTSNADTKTTMAAKSKDWQCPDCWVNNKTDAEKCVCCGGKKPSQSMDKPSKCSICKLADSQAHVDKCVNCEKVKVNNIVIPAVADTSKWKCGDCWVSNNESDEKCICCGAKNPKKSGAALTNAGSNDTSDWKCDDCWVQNKSTVKACVACGGARPGAAKPGLFNTTKPPDGLKNIVTAQTYKWECTNCLVRNDTDKIKCVCCEAQRPGTMKESENKSFNFGMNASSFKFGIDPKAHEAATKESKTAEVKTKPEESETNNNVLPKTPSFSFGVPAKKTEDQTDSTKKVEDKTDSGQKVNFTFGVPASKPSATPTTTPIFGTAIKPTESTPKTSKGDNEKLQEVPIVNFGIPKTQEVPKVNFGVPKTHETPKTQESPKFNSLFTSPATSKEITTSEAPPLTNAFKYAAEKKESPIKSSLAVNPLGSPMDNAPNTNSFSFSMFGSASTTTATLAAPSQTTAVTSNVTLFSKTEPTTATAIFQKPDDKPTVSLFQPSDTQTTAASVATASPFGFGTSTPVTAPQSDKPKFNFTFGSANKTEAPAPFKPAFGAPSDSSITNKFTLPTGNVSGSTLGTGNAASAPALAGNLLGGNDMNNSLTNNSQTNVAASTGLFGTPVQKENMWSTTNNTTPNNIFVSSATTNSLQKPTAFSFGSQFSSGGATTFGSGAQSTPTTFGNGGQAVPATFGSAQATPATFGSASTPAAFGSASTPAAFGSAQATTPVTFGSGAQTPVTFGSAVQAPPVTFGSGAQATPSTFGAAATPVFGLGSQNTSSQPSLFSSSVQNPPTGGLFAQPASNPAPAMGMFGTPSVGATPTFGTPNASLPPFEAPSLTPAPAPAFNFGAAQSTGVFGFGQQAQQPQTQQAGVYSFGGGAAAGVQFSMGTMGSAPSPARRVRKAVRKNTPR